MSAARLADRAINPALRHQEALILKPSIINVDGIRMMRHVRVRPFASVCQEDRPRSRRWNDKDNSDKPTTIGQLGYSSVIYSASFSRRTFQLGNGLS
ncbi:Hypothetical protein NTJ_04009 [Nesidiocoris tenuis]|uniref:Uncharacterized protein n=1 Tax=Nesidiocoris tenuis TaxID=355587 RepID=A0ABN7AK02_9HEMI|nr:Hypothetical protein NTJ_04009 [Nesidiocoris tenuis]